MKIVGNAGKIIDRDADKLFKIKEVEVLSSFTALNQVPNGCISTTCYQQRGNALKSIQLSWPTNRRSTGFTLLELMVVVGILMILMAAIITGLRTLQNQTQLSSAVDTVLGSIGMARNTAIGLKEIVHVRIENNSATDQAISIYKFPKVTDALTATTELAVQKDGLGDRPYGWNNSHEDSSDYANIRIQRKSLPDGIWFETEYNPGTESDPKLWDFVRGQVRPKDEVHEDYETLYYSGDWDYSGTYPVEASDTNLLPKSLYDPAIPGHNHKLLYFNPDGTASANIVLLIRNDVNLRYIRVFKGGKIDSGDVAKLDDKDTGKFNPTALKDILGY